MFLPNTLGNSVNYMTLSRDRITITCALVLYEFQEVDFVSAGKLSRKGVTGGRWRVEGLPFDERQIRKVT